MHLHGAVPVLRFIHLFVSLVHYVPGSMERRHWWENLTAQGRGRGGMVQISLVSNHPQQAIGLFSLLGGRFFNEEIQESNPAFHVFSQAAATPTAGAKDTYTSIVHHLSVAISAPVSFKGWRLVTLADRRLRVWRLHWSRSALPPPN